MRYSLHITACLTADREPVDVMSKTRDVGSFAEADEIASRMTEAGWHGVTGEVIDDNEDVVHGTHRQPLRQ